MLNDFLWGVFRIAQNEPSSKVVLLGGLEAGKGWL